MITILWYQAVSYLFLGLFICISLLICLHGWNKEEKKRKKLEEINKIIQDKNEYLYDQVVKLQRKNFELEFNRDLKEISDQYK